MTFYFLFFILLVYHSLLSLLLIILLLDARKTLVPTLVGHLISYIDNRMISTQYRSDDDGNIHCLRAINQILTVLHCGQSLVTILYYCIEPQYKGHLGTRHLVLYI